MADSSATPLELPLRRAEEGKRLIVVGIIAFAVTGAALFAAALHRSTADRGAPGHAISEIARPQPDGTFLVTLDARDSHRWVGYDLGSGRPTQAAEQADLYLRRYLLRAPAGAADLGGVRLEEAKLPSGAEWIRDAQTKGELCNPALSSWYDYSYWSHRLEPKGHTFAVRRAQRRGIAYFRIESYRCDPGAPGCVTFRYRLIPGGSDGS
ncbi:MAG TPA: hypothetical protein VGJ84_02875 [Polyangiaceae bacterium]